MTLKSFNNKYKYKDCHVCEGTGYHEYRNCNKPISDCCGGCYKTEWCDECNATGLEVDEEYGVILMKDRWYEYGKRINAWRLQCKFALGNIITKTKEYGRVN